MNLQIYSIHAKPEEVEEIKAMPTHIRKRLTPIGICKGNGQIVHSDKSINVVFLWDGVRNLDLLISYGNSSYEVETHQLLLLQITNNNSGFLISNLFSGIGPVVPPKEDPYQLFFIAVNTGKKER